LRCRCYCVCTGEMTIRLQHLAKTILVVSEVWGSLGGVSPFLQQSVMAELLAAAPGCTLAQLRGQAQGRVSALNREKLMEECLLRAMGDGGARFGGAGGGGSSGRMGGYRPPPAAAAAGGGRSSATCFKCGGIGHYARDCQGRAGAAGAGSGANAAPLGVAGHLLMGAPPQ
jgi:hypothetical protein